MKKVLIFTAEPSNFVPKELKKAAEAMGAEAEILNVTTCVITEGVDNGTCASKVCKVVKTKVGEGDDAEEKCDLVDVTCNHDTVIIPRLNEHHLEMKLSMLRRLETQGATLLNTLGSMDLCNDKLMSQVTLNSAGIKTPFSFTCQNEDGVEFVIDSMEKNGRLKYPCILKTLRGTHGIGVMKMDSRASLVSTAQMLLKEGLEFMVQEFIEHDQSARIIMIGDEVLAANLRGQPKDKGEFRTNSHLGSETEPYTPPEDEVALGKRIVELFGSNFCAIDYILVGEGEAKKIIVLEVNGSPGLENIQKNWPDKNLAANVIKYALKRVGFEANEPTAPVAQTVPAPVAPAATPVASPEEGPHDPSPEPAPINPADPTPAPEGVINEIEKVLVHRICVNDEPLEARIDTGAATSSLHVDKLEFENVKFADMKNKSVKFTRGDVAFRTDIVRTVLIKDVHTGENTRRPVIKLDMTIGGKRLNQVEFTLGNRSKMQYQVLVGRNVLQQLGMPVLVPTITNYDAETEESNLQVGEEE